MESGDSLLLSPPDSKSLSSSSPKPQPQSSDVQAAVTMPMVPTHSPPPPVSSPAPAPSGEEGPEDGPHSDDDDIPPFFEHVPIINQTQSSIGFRAQSSSFLLPLVSGHEADNLEDQDELDCSEGYQPQSRKESTLLTTPSEPEMPCEAKSSDVSPCHPAMSRGRGRGRGRGQGRGSASRGRKGKHEQVSAASPGSASPAAVSAVSAGARKRSVRCNVCGPCQAEDCGTCNNCLDKPKFGGPNKKKQTCINRKCVNMLHKTRPDTTASTMTTTDDLSQLPLDEVLVDIVGHAAVDSSNTREEHSASSSAPALSEDGPQTPGIISFGSTGFFIPSSTGAEDSVMSQEISQLSAEAVFQEKFKMNLMEENIPFKENTDGLLDIQLKDDGPGHVIKRPQESGSTTPVPDTNSPELVEGIAEIAGGEVEKDTPITQEFLDFKGSYHGVLAADEAEAKLRKQRLDKAYICRESNVTSGKYIISYSEGGEVRHFLLPTEDKYKKTVVELFKDFIRTKDELQYPLPSSGSYDWSEAHFQHPRGREKGRRGAVRGQRGAARGQQQHRGGGGRGRSQSGEQQHGEVGCCGHGPGQCQCEEGGDHVGSCEDHDHDHDREGHDTAHDDNDGSHKTRLCCVCSEGFATKSSLDNHVKIHRLVWCKNCHNYISANTFWSCHRYQCTPYHSPDQIRCQVDSCSFSTKWRNVMKKHQEMHNKNPFNCRSCDRCFETAERLEIHVINSHSETGHRCQFCDRSFPDSWRCKRHVRTQHLFPTIRNATGLFKMDCGDGVRKKRGRTVHTCSECTYKTKVRKRLHRHIKAKHTPKTPTMFVCQGEGCHFKHHFKSRYKRHIKTCPKFKVKC